MACLLDLSILQWFRCLTLASIHDWDELGQALYRKFGERANNFSLLEQLTTIKRAPNEMIVDFNFRFQRMWERILALLRPSPQGTFLYFIRDLNSNIVVMM